MKRVFLTFSRPDGKPIEAALLERVLEMARRTQGVTLARTAGIGIGEIHYDPEHCTVLEIFAPLRALGLKVGIS